MSNTPTALIVDIEYHRCIKCQHEKPETEFPKSSAGKLRGDCKTCANKYLSEYYSANKQKMDERNKANRQLRTRKNGNSK